MSVYSISASKVQLTTGRRAFFHSLHDTCAFLILTGTLDLLDLAAATYINLNMQFQNTIMGGAYRRHRFCVWPTPCLHRSYRRLRDVDTMLIRYHRYRFYVLPSPVYIVHIVEIVKFNFKDRNFSINVNF